MDIWQHFKKWFKDEQTSSSQKPFIQEPLMRTADELQDYERWTRTVGREQLLDWLRQQYEGFLLDGETGITETIDFLNTPSAKGFVLHFDTQLHNATEFQHFFDYLKACVLTMNYKTYMSDTRTYNRTRNGKTWVETIERHYLKPRFKVSDDQKVQQLFGNIKIELLRRDAVIKNLQFSATRYHDRNFEEADGFGELMKGILAY